MINFSTIPLPSNIQGRCGLVQIIKGKPRGKGLKYYALCDPDSGYIYAAILHSKNYVEFEEVWGRIVAICYALLRGDPSNGLRSFLDQGYYVRCYLFYLNITILRYLY